MSKPESILRFPKTLSVMPTYTCPAACKDCGTLSSPSERSNISLEVMLSAIRQAKELGFYNVVFTGGEPTLRWPDLLKAIQYTVSLDMPARIVTNAHWAVSPQRAEHYVAELCSAGLNEINYSTGDEHVHFIPLDRIINAVVAAVEAGLRTCVMVELRSERRVTGDQILEDARIKSLTPAQTKLLSVHESPWMPMNPEMKELYPEGLAANESNVRMRTGCDSVLQTYVMQADGRVGACCGLGMRLIPELNVGHAEGDDFLRNAVKESEEDLLKIWIHYKGPEKILAWAAQKDPSIEWEDMYAHHCQACLRIYKDPKVAAVIMDHYRDEIADLVQSIWLEEEFIPGKLGTAAKASRRYSKSSETSKLKSRRVRVLK